MLYQKINLLIHHCRNRLYQIDFLFSKYKYLGPNGLSNKNPLLIVSCMQSKITTYGFYMRIFALQCTKWIKKTFWIKIQQLKRIEKFFLYIYIDLK